MKVRIRTVLLVVLIIVFAVSIGKVIWSGVEYQSGAEVYAEAEALAGLPDLSGIPLPVPGQDYSGLEGEQSSASQTGKSAYLDPYADALREMDFTALREVNGDVLGWLLIPGTGISYPLLQGEDNSYYLNHTWRNGRNSVGAIFMECTNSSDLSDFNTIIYGHRMNNRSMFGILHYYKDVSYWAAHPYVYITNDSGTYRYEIFAAYEVSVEGETYRLGIRSDEGKQSFINWCMEQSVIDTGITPTVYDRILTLSTCTGNGHATRWVVQAVLWGEHPDVPEEEAPAETGEPFQEEPPEAPEAEAPAAPPEESSPANEPAEEMLEEEDTESLFNISTGSQE